MSERTIELEVLRYNPETDEVPWYQIFSVPCQEEWVVLDALNYIKDHMDPTLSFRWSCHMAVCGSCGMMINGEPMLSCKAFIRQFRRKIKVEPLAHFPIERDLVVVLDDVMEKLPRVQPWLVPHEERSIEAGEYRQTPGELLDFKQYSMCINCMLCYAACPQYGLDDAFIGPALLALAHRYNQDSRDAGRPEREGVTATHEGVWTCSFVGACSDVCPKAVDPGGAIQQMKIASSMDWYLERLGRLPGQVLPSRDRLMFWRKSK